jgi:hypothetical protein
MNKKIYKGYELAEAVDNGILNLNQKVKTANNMEYYDCTIGFILSDISKNVMFKEFEILEDNTEEIEELEYYCIGQAKNANLTNIIDKIEEIRVAVNQIRKDLNND